MPEYPEDSAWPGVRSPNLSRDPLGTAGELTPGPDDLDPDKRRDREQLEAMGFEIVDHDETHSDDIDDWEMGWDAIETLFDHESNSDEDDKSEPQLAFDPQSESSEPFTLW